MTGKDIPLKVIYTIHPDGRTTSRKEPLYRLHSAKEELDEQMSLAKRGADLGWYYGTKCEKCCGVFPKFFTEETFAAKGFYVCMVCGKESRHRSMAHLARESWNNGEFVFIPDAYQYSIFDYLKGVEQ